MAQRTHVTVAASRILSHRKSDYGLCRRCGIEITVRNDRPDRLCMDCRSTAPNFGRQKEDTNG